MVGSNEWQQEIQEGNGDVRKTPVPISCGRTVLNCPGSRMHLEIVNNVFNFISLESAVQPEIIFSPCFFVIRTSGRLCRILYEDASRNNLTVLFILLAQGSYVDTC